jgi:thioredoxin reductase (NADPH)
MGQNESQRTDRDALMSRFTRPEQTFPTLAPAEIERMRHFGDVRTYKHGELLFETGKPGRACSSC